MTPPSIHSSIHTEGTMETHDFYFLAMVLAAFGSFAVAVVIATLQYKAWLRRNPQAVPAHANDDRVPARLKRAAPSSSSPLRHS